MLTLNAKYTKFRPSILNPIVDVNPLNIVVLLIILLEDKTPEAPIAAGVPVRSHYSR